MYHVITFRNTSSLTSEAGLLEKLQLPIKIVFLRIPDERLTYKYMTVFESFKKQLSQIEHYRKAFLNSFLASFFLFLR